MFLADAVEKTSLQDNRRIDLNYMLGLVFFLIVMSFLTTVFMALKEYYYDSDSLPVDTVSIRGNLNELEIARISAALTDSGQLHNFIKLDVDSIQETVKSIPWVESDSVRKQWPAYLYLDVAEKRAVARWKDDRLLSEHSGVYEAPDGEFFGNLVMLDGPEAKAGYMYQNYLSFRDLLSPVGCAITKLVLTERQSWELYMDNGVKLVLGRENIDAVGDGEADQPDSKSVVQRRLERFTKVYPQIRKNFVNISYIDLRYDNGMAIGWKNEPGSNAS